jgi:heterodisulfide reductase subunit A-like polyferredoxin
MLKLPPDGFLMEAHFKLRPVAFVGASFFTAGTAHGPKFLEETIAQAKAAAARAVAVVGQDRMWVGGEVAMVDAEPLRGLSDLRTHLPLRRCCA